MRSIVIGAVGGFLMNVALDLDFLPFLAFIIGLFAVIEAAND